MVKTAPSDAGGVGLIPGPGTKIPHVGRQLNPHSATRDARVLIRKSLCHSTKTLRSLINIFLIK